MLPSAEAQWRKELVRPGSHWRFMLRVLRSAKIHRTTGHAAEMAFFAVLTLVPSTIAVGSALGLSRELFGGGVVREAEDAIVDAVTTLMGPDLADTVIAPFVHAQLQQASGGVALGGLLIAWWLSSHLFESTGHALDTIYDVEDSRTTFSERMLALGFAMVSVVLVAITVEMMVVGPLGDPDAGLPSWLGLGEVYTFVWSVMRWPTLLALVVAFLMCLYRFTPNVKQSWRDVFPGAVGGAALWILAALIFRLTAPLGMRPTIASDDPTVVIIGQSVNAVVATVLWAYLASAAILLGGEANALLRKRHDTEAAQPRVQSWVGRMLVDVDGWSVGTIDHVVLDRDTGESRWMAVMTGKFGTRLTMVPVADAWEGPEGGIRVPFTRDEVLAAPRAGAHGPPTSAEARRLGEHYAGRCARRRHGNGSCAGDPFAARDLVRSAQDGAAPAAEPAATGPGGAPAAQEEAAATKDAAGRA